MFSGGYGRSCSFEPTIISEEELNTNPKFKSIDDFEDINMLMFVAIHELAHIATDEEGHTDAFWENMKFLLEEGINIGIYIQQDFTQNPEEYCGMMVTSSPLDEAKPIKK